MKENKTNCKVNRQNSVEPTLKTDRVSLVFRIVVIIIMLESML